MYINVKRVNERERERERERKREREREKERERDLFIQEFVPNRSDVILDAVNSPR